MLILPKISIITPTLNSEAEIKRCLLSVAEQTYPQKEHIIIDGLSSDGTLEIVQKYAEKYPHLRYISEKDNGIYDAMNKGIALATGEWLYFMGSDDLFLNKQILEKIFVKNAPDKFDVIYGNVRFKHSKFIHDGKFSSLKLMEKCICHQAIFCRKKVLQKFGGFNTRYRGAADWEFNMKWFNDKKIRRKYIRKTIAVYNEKGFSFQFKDELFWNDRPRLVKKYFPPFYGLFINKNIYRLTDVPKKGWNVLRQDGFCQFAHDLKKYVLYGRGYFKDGRIKRRL